MGSICCFEVGGFTLVALRLWFHVTGFTLIVEKRCKSSVRARGVQKVLPELRGILLAKSARSMMEVSKLALTGKIHNVLLVSNSHDNAILLLAPFKAFFEANNRVEQDYGVQKNLTELSYRQDDPDTPEDESANGVSWSSNPKRTNYF